MYKTITIILLMLLVLIPAASAELGPTKITVSVQESAKLNDYVRIDGQLTYANGDEITVGYMDMVMVAVYINGYRESDTTQCDATGKFWGYYPMDAVGTTDIKVVFDDKPYMNLAGSESNTQYVIVTENITPPIDVSNFTKFISYAKGFFILSFFCALFTTIGVGGYSMSVNDPQKKSDAENSVFSLMKILGTVTILYMAVLFFAS